MKECSRSNSRSTSRRHNTEKDRTAMTSSKIEIPAEVKSDPAALMASLQLMPSPVPNPEIIHTKVCLNCPLPSFRPSFLIFCSAPQIHFCAQPSNYTDGACILANAYKSVGRIVIPSFLFCVSNLSFRLSLPLSLSFSFSLSLCCRSLAHFRTHARTSVWS